MFPIVAKGSGQKCGDGTSVGLFIPLPVHLAKKFPSLHDDGDGSPSHVTLLILGKIKGAEQERLVEVLRKICGRYYWSEAKATLSELSSFDHGHQTVPHLKVEFSKDFASFRRLIKQELEQEGFAVEDRHVEWSPHVTLDYLPADESWEGKQPKGSWTFDQIEVWGLPEVVPKIPLGKVKKAYTQEGSMHPRLRGLQARLARLHRRASSSKDLVELLPSGARIWKSLNEIQIYETDSTFDGIWDQIHDLKKIMLAKAQGISAIRLAWVQEAQRDLSKISTSLASLAETGVDVKKIEKEVAELRRELVSAK